MCLASALGIVLSVAALKFKTVNLLLKIVSPIPKTVFLPIVMLFFGIGEVSKLTFLLLFTLFPLCEAFKTTFLNTDRDTFFLCKKAGMSKMHLFADTVLLPSVPDILTALGHSFASAFAVLMLAESFGTLKGLGFFMLDCFLKMKYLKMFLAVLISATLGSLIPLIFEKTALLLCPWRKNAVFSRDTYIVSGQNNKEQTKV